MSITQQVTGHRPRSHDADFTDWVIAHQGGLLRTAYLLAGDRQRGEDLVQTVLAKAYLAWPRVIGADSPEAYVRRMLVNESTSWWRRLWRSREVSVAEVFDAALAPSPDAARDLADETVWTQVRNLPVRQRTAVLLRIVEDRTEADTAQLMGCSVGTVKSLTSRGLATLRIRLGDLGYPGGVR